MTMKHFIIPAVLWIAIGSYGFAQQAFIDDFLKKWQNAKDYTIEFAEAMPADHYAFRPMEEEMTFGRQLVHICGNMIWLSSTYLGTEPFPGDTDHPSEAKEDVIRLLHESFDYTADAVRKFNVRELDQVVQFFAGPITKRRVFFLLADHVTHHRGQLVVYLRLQGIVPPPYRGW